MSCRPPSQDTSRRTGYRDLSNAGSGSVDFRVLAIVTHILW
jgi:hypothetical protein